MAISYGRTGEVAVSADAQKGKMTVSYDEATADDVFVPAPPGGSKTLKINIDLMLWRARQARMNARLTLDLEKRRTLLREAEEGLKRCLALDPADARTYVVMGKLLMVQKRYDEARSLYTQGCTNTGNTNPYIWSAWGWLEFKTGNVARARKLFDAATVVDEAHACAWHKWGTLEKSQGNYLRARDLFMQGIQRCRRRPQAQNAYLYNALAVMAAQLGRVAEARAWFEEGTRTLEGAASVALWQAWAVMEAKQGDPSAVRYLFKKALAANPRSRYVHLAWALWERKQGNVPLCIELLKRGSALNPTDAALFQAWALVEWRDRGSPDAARGLFEAGLRADPGHLHLWQAWGVMEASLGNLDRARQLYQEGVWADPRSRNTVWVLHAWGCLEQAQGKLSLARELFKAAIRVDPKSEAVWSTWITMEQEAGFLERAEELRIRQAEQQWEFEVPAGFTTRPSSGSPLTALTDTLARFFRARDAASASPSAAAAAAASGSARSVKDFLPADFESDMRLEDVLAAADSGAGDGMGGADAAALAFGSLTGVQKDLAAAPVRRPQFVRGPGVGGGAAAPAADAGLLPEADVTRLLQVLDGGGEVADQDNGHAAASSSNGHAAEGKVSKRRAGGPRAATPSSSRERAEADKQLVRPVRNAAKSSMDGGAPS